ncbi:hypothetical protein J2128_001535 [Methanomicrobium sp. W14]|uniref:DUF4062 domain-containing protein n=1 Tax=Methanomicrobium sp. W14 TaxID=2817839 RepID=UPI001AE37837|nr:DUF4062 domain-containing protein [Methanomicrobium sp. W14]MBP2133581.1 hypothetical protein [Methanomicrobium sp. W14]
MENKKKLTIFVSSTVYGFEELLDKTYTLLTKYGYEVWMSHKGTVPVFSDRSAFENCINAVVNCDLFLGLITPFYGSGRNGEEISITHQELKKAIELNKPRWLLVHDHVVFAKSLLKYLGYDTKLSRKKLSLGKNRIFDDLRVIDMYEEALISQKPLSKRSGNWVQKYYSDDDVIIFANAQFFRYQEVEAFVKENFEDYNHVSKAIRDSGGRL